MSKALKKALEDSITRWEENARAISPFLVHMSAGDCPLCMYFYQQAGELCCSLGKKRCPVFAKTGQRGCKGTPYEAVYEARNRWRRGEDGAEQDFRCAAQAEVEFLKSLRGTA